MTDIIKIRVPGGVDGFIEDKDWARQVRQEKILPSLNAGAMVVFDFAKGRYTTQSFIHALIGEALKRFGDQALERMEFKNCSPQIKSVIELVVDYSLGGFAGDRAVNE